MQQPRVIAALAASSRSESRSPMGAGAPSLSHSWEERRLLAGGRRSRWASKTGVCDCRPFASAIGPIAAVGRQAALSVERADDLAVGAALLDVRQRLEGPVERERLVDERAEVAGVVEGGQLAQLPAVGLHEQKRVAHA